tara:strand:+ start:100 stop:549 length:450 start_codon:yes stop_codon:yes gene_type:complete
MKIIINKSLVLENIQESSENIKASYKLYKTRPKYHFISAKKTLKYTDHVKFVKNNPYRKWFIIKFNKKFIGTIYFTTENSIGYYILDKYIEHTEVIFLKLFIKIKPMPKKLSINQGNFTINLSPKNIKYQDIISNIGGKIIQKTFIFDK